MKTSIVFLAAGLGSRYGGLKQMDGVGPNGETILDYSSFDALRAGFSRIVFVIREEIHADFRARIGDRIATHADLQYAFQKDDDIPPGFKIAAREKPWGTGHAVLAAADVVDGPFAVANADDFYGRSSIAAIGEFLNGVSKDRSSGDRSSRYAMVGFRLGDTLSARGTVSRGVCQTNENGRLVRITETMGIEKSGDDGFVKRADGESRTIAGDTPVSMNLWGFERSFFDRLRNDFHTFLQEHSSSPTAEFHLPACVYNTMLAGAAQVSVLPTSDAWVGVTHRDDRPHVVAHVADLINAGVYPHDLWK